MQRRRTGYAVVVVVMANASEDFFLSQGQSGPLPLPRGAQTRWGIGGCYTALGGKSALVLRETYQIPQPCHRAWGSWPDMTSTISQLPNYHFFAFPVPLCRSPAVNSPAKVSYLTA